MRSVPQVIQAARLKHSRGSWLLKWYSDSHFFISFFLSGLLVIHGWAVPGESAIIKSFFTKRGGGSQLVLRWLLGLSFKVWRALVLRLENRLAFAFVLTNSLLKPIKCSNMMKFYSTTISVKKMAFVLNKNCLRKWVSQRLWGYDCTCDFLPFPSVRSAFKILTTHTTW